MAVKELSVGRAVPLKNSKKLPKVKERYQAVEEHRLPFAARGKLMFTIPR